MSTVNFLLAPLIWVLDVTLALLTGMTVLVGAFRFLLSTGANPAYVMRRRQWFEETVLGRKMRLRDYAQFAAWHAEVAGRRMWRVRE